MRLTPAFDGMWQDDPRINLPKGRAWNMVDYVPELLGAPATQRGGWAYASPSLTAADASATYVIAGIYAPFTAGAQLLVVDDASKFLKVTSSASAVSVGTVHKPLQNPVMHQQKVLIPSTDGSTAFDLYDGAAVTSITAGPSGRYATVFVNRSLVASTTAQPQRVYFSAAGDPTSWSLTGTSASYIDVGFEVKGLAALPNVVLIFGNDRTARLRGSTPPPGTDMILDDPIFSYGIVDARSVAVNGSQCVFANTTGIFLSNGTALPEDLTYTIGLKGYWRNLMSTYASTYTVVGEWFGNLYVVSVMDGTTFKDCIVIDVPKRQGWRLSNIPARALFKAAGAGTELYMGLRSAPRVAQLSTMFTPAAAYKADADGTAVSPVYESPFYDSKTLGIQRWKDVYLEYDLRDAASDIPTMTLAYITGPNQTSYTSLSPTFAATTAKKTMRRTVHKKTQGAAFKVTRTNAASFARIYGIAGTIYPLEGSRLS